MALRILPALVLVVAAGTALSGQPQTSALLVTGATVIDGTGAAPIPNAAVLVVDGRIAAVGPASAVKAPSGTRTVDARGKFVIPGLWESHMHYRWWHGDLLTHYGITTAVDLGSQTEWILAVADAIRKGKVQAPRLYTAGWILHGTPPPSRRPGRALVARSEAYNEYHERENFPNHMTVRGGPEKIGAFTRQEIAAGVDSIKVFPDMTREELRAITTAAHEANIPVIGHTENAYASIEDGLDGITHLQGIARTLMSEEKLKELAAGELNTAYAYMLRDRMDELVSFMVKRGTFLGPCLIHDHAPAVRLSGEFEREDREILTRPELNYLFDDTRTAMPLYLHQFRSDSDRWGEFPPIEALPPEAVKDFRDGYENAKEFLRRYAKAGGKLFIGTDLGGTSTIPGLIVHREMRVWVEEVGLTPMQALLAATRDSAALLRKDEILGTIEPGKIGDLLVLSADPLANIRNTEKIELVVRDGRVVDHALHANYFSPIREIGSEGAHNNGLAIPGIIGLTPRVATEGDGDSKVVLEASGLHITSKVYVDDVLVPSRMLDGEHLEITIPASLLKQGGSRAVTVFNGRPGGGRSKPYAFLVRFK